MSEESLKALLGTVEEPESEEYDEIYPDEIAFKRYDFIDLINSVGTPDFKAHYQNILNNDYNIDDRRELARDLVDKVEEVYEIELHLPEVPTPNEIASIFKFVKFIEYEYVDFIADVWKFMNIDLRSDIRDFCLSNADRILLVIDEQIESHFLPQIISDFLRTYNKDNMISLFVNLTEKSKMMIEAKIREGELKNGSFSD